VSRARLAPGVNRTPCRLYNATLMGSHRTSKLGSISAVLALVVSSGLAGVCPHTVPERGSPQITAEMPDAHAEMHHAAMQHEGSPHSEHPPQGPNPNCVCAGACLNGAPLKQAAKPTLVSVPRVSSQDASPAPTLPVLRDPTAFLRPLPNAPPLA